MVIDKTNKGKRSVKDIKKLWDMFCLDESPEVPLREQVRANPRSFHQLKRACGKYRGQFFKIVYKKSDYVVWLLTQGP